MIKLHHCGSPRLINLATVEQVVRSAFDQHRQEWFSNVHFSSGNILTVDESLKEINDMIKEHLHVDR